MFRNPADILNYGGIKCYSVYWVRTRGREVAGSRYYLNKNKNNLRSGHYDAQTGQRDRGDRMNSKFVHDLNTLLWHACPVPGI